MKRLGCIFFFIPLLFLYKVNAQADGITDSIAKKMYWYALQNPSTKLFVHFDKNIYTNSENVWFTTYLLKSNPKDFHHTLSVAVIRNDDRSVLTQNKFVVDNGLAFGNFFLPDSLPTGNYSFVCYTNQLVDGYPSALFIQPITIKSVNAAGFVANLSLADSITPNMDSATILLKAYTTDIALLKGVPVRYFIGDRSHPFKLGKMKTDKFGEARISIPLKQITATNNVLQTEIDNGKEIKTFNMKLPVYKKEASVKFYPEGGSLVSGTGNIVGWEVLDNEGEPLMVSAGLYKDDQLLQTIQTNAYGMEKFTITPQPGSQYYVKLQSPAYSKDTAYKLPVASHNAPVINIANALAADTLIVRLNNALEVSHWIVMIHNYNNTFITASVTAPQSSTLLKISLQDVPKGLSTFTLLDTLGRPRAERLFFAHYDKKAWVNITTDSTVYLPRQKVELKFKVTDGQKKSLQSLVSIACVQDNRFDVKKMTDIESYAYLRSEMASLPFKNKLLSGDADNKEYLETLLLIKGWRRYTWQDLAIVKASDTLKKRTSLAFKGITVLEDKPLKKPVQLNLKKYLDTKIATLEFISTDSFGHFVLAPDNLLSEPNRQLELSVNNRLQDLYAIRVNDPYTAINRNLAASLSLSNYDVRSFAQTSQAVVLKSEEGGKRLLDVKVVAKIDNTIYSPRRGPNICGDYVCSYGILNCRNHVFDGYEPILGRMYNGVIYSGCSSLRTDMKKEFLISLDGIYKKKEFYLTDLSKTDASDPQYLSTLYWNHSLLTNDKGEAKATFYTGDITGKFRVVIQGITNNDVLYGENFFEVRR